MSSSEWKEIKLIRLTEKIGSGSTPKGGSSVYLKSGIPFIRSQNIYNCEFSENGIVYINEDSAKKLENVKLLYNDVLLNITGDSVARCTIVPKKYIGGRVNQHVAIIRTDNRLLDAHYLKYYLVNHKMQLKLLSLAKSGGTRAALNKGMIESLEIFLPPLPEQKAIAHILSTLDEKIEVNNQINKTLENIAQTIFKQWFVDFEFPNGDGEPYKSSGGEMVESELGMIPKGWEVRNIGYISKAISKGTTPRKKDVENAKDKAEIKFIKVKDIDNDGLINEQGLELISESIHNNQLKRSILEFKDILVSIAGTIGRVSYINKRLVNSNSNQAIAFIRLKDINKYFNIIYYKLKSKEFQDSINSKIVQGVQANISLSVIRSEKIVLPCDMILNKYNAVLNEIFGQIEIMNSENITLKKLRDSLLPKLMSGEIRVPIEEN